MSATAPLAALDAIERDAIPAAISYLAARLLRGAPTTADDELLTPDEVAALLKVDRRYVYRHAASLGAKHVSKRKLRFPRSAIERRVRRAQ